MTKPSNKTKKVQRGLGRGLSTLLGDAEVRDLLQEHHISNKKNNTSSQSSKALNWESRLTRGSPISTIVELVLNS